MSRLDARTRLVLAGLATWRLSHLLVEEDGPFDAVLRAREALGASRLGALMDCFGCTSVWVAAPVASLAVRGRRDVLLAWPARSGAAMLIDRALGHEEGGAPDVVLRPAPLGIAGEAA